jgi:hypothetical protein
MIGSIGQPLLFLLALGFGFGPIFQRAGGGKLYPVSSARHYRDGHPFYSFVFRH